ncbi:hypothetical protein J7T55_005187 [Diaporthe amygdali]|uniref:uncharacterized protein n=1 Tax=Phomopsis amygdali TaxID=1214568 RepID=UPI0022FEA5A6|nr:uncharacterized protein J7T55_005187 [Diaporthe amygdali]KAJ0116241.1 hypothetical protein J7T55_005187 [Diaporthe amygdali]
MPSFRGINVSILAELEVGKLPEYPHPDGSSVHLGPSDNVHQDPTRVSKVSPTISVYIPSVPGAQFWISYIVEQKPNPPSHLFFKLFMNGRHITSWGINPEVKSKGRVEKALYEPSDRWNHEEDGTIMKPDGIEARYFHFVGGQEEKSVAEDGGLIEIQVFRAKGRKRRAAKLDQYRHQEKYGIAAPSGGLLDNPQDVSFYDFYLIDPKDAPFASFRLHYRSWSNLRELNLIPADDSSIFETFSTSTFTDSVDPTPDASIDDTPLERGLPQTETVCFDADESVFDDDSFSEEQKGMVECSKPRKEKTFVLRTPPQLRPGSGTSQKLPQPSKSLRDGPTDGIPEWYLQRPLPDLPLPELPVGVPNESYGPSRKTSTASIAASLLSYVKDASFLDESVKYGHAQEVPVYKTKSNASLDRDQPPPDCSDLSVSDYECYLSSDDDLRVNQSQSALSENHPVSMGKMSENNTDFLDNNNGSSMMGDGKTAGSKASKPVVTVGEKGIDFSRFPHLQLDEWEWIRRSPSPKVSPRRVLSPRLGRLWDTLRRNRSRSPLRQPLCEAPVRNYSTPHLFAPDGKEKHGNWI